MQEYYGEEERDEFYNEECIIGLRDDDEINSAEEGFMIGYMGA